MIHQCETVFYIGHRNFEEKLNTAELTPFTNGVLDLKTLEFRDGSPEDCMTMSTKIKYEKYNPEEDVVKQIMAWFEQVQPNAEQRLYLQKVCGLFLTPNTHLQQVWVLTGSGQNGKSFFIESILRPVMGDFFATAAKQLLTRKRENANETNEALKYIIKKRIAVFSEPGKNEVIQADILKNISGQDHLTMRGNYESQQDVLPHFKSIIVCNDIPKLSEDSYAVWRRIRVIDWPMTFKHNPDQGKTYEKNLDLTLSEKVKVWPKYFAGCMVYWLKLLREDKAFNPPLSVVRHTNKYREDNDDWREFCKIYLKNEPGILKWTDLLTVFKKWHKEYFLLDCKAKPAEIKCYFEKYFNEESDKRYVGSDCFRGWKSWTIVEHA